MSDNLGINHAICSNESQDVEDFLSSIFDTIAGGVELLDRMGVEGEFIFHCELLYHTIPVL